MSAKDATITAKDETTTTKDATMTAKDATLDAKDAPMSVKAAEPVFGAAFGQHTIGYDKSAHARHPAALRKPSLPLVSRFQPKYPDYHLWEKNVENIHHFRKSQNDRFKK